MVSQFFKTSPPLQCQKLALRSQTQRTALRRPLLILGVAADSAPPQAGERPGKQLPILQPPRPPGKPVPVGLVHLGYPLKLPSMDPLLLRRAHKQQLHHRQPILVGRSRRQHIPAAGQIFLRQPPGQIFQSTAGHIHTKRLFFAPLFHLVLPARTKLHALFEILLDFNNFFTEYPACPCLSPGERV